MGIRMGFPGMHKLIRELNKKKEDMKQPKFKFGETVKSNKYQFPKPFTVKRVEWGVVFSLLDTKREGYRYFPDPEKNEFWPEEDLELYQEPQKKKLYAHKVTIKFGFASFGGPISPPMHQTIWTESEDIGFPCIVRRAPDLDIDYDKLK